MEAEVVDDVLEGCNLYEDGKFEEALPLLQKAAKAGNVTAMCHLGWMYHSGEGVKKNSNIAIKYYKQAIDICHFAPALNGLAILYENGDGVEADLEKATQLYNEAAVKGYISAMYNLGRLHEYNNPEDISGTMAMYQKAIDAVNSGTNKIDHKQRRAAADAMCKIGYFYEEKEDLNGKKRDFEANSTIALEWYKRAAAEGSVDGKYNVACMLEQGVGIDEPQMEESRAIFEELASNGDPEAQLRLGAIYEHGRGVEVNLKKAAHYYEIAAGTCIKLEEKQAGNNNSNLTKTTTDSFFDLGVLYKSGRGVIQSNKKAFKWFSQAANRGDAEAEFQLALLYESGCGIPVQREDGIIKEEKEEEEEEEEESHPVPDYENARRMYESAAEKGNLDAMYNMGLYYQNGTGTPGGIPDGEVAMSWFKRAAKLGDVGAQLKVGLCYDAGVLIEQDFSKAMKYYKQAAHQNHSGAVYNIGILYEQGLGVEPDEKQALSWFEKSAVMENKEAMLVVADFYHQGIGTSVDFEKGLYWYINVTLSTSGNGTYDQYNTIEKLLKEDIEPTNLQVLLNKGLEQVFSSKKNNTRTKLIHLFCKLGGIGPLWSTKSNHLFLKYIQRTIRTLLQIHQYRCIEGKEGEITFTCLPVEILFVLFEAIGKMSWDIYGESSISEINSTWDI